MKLEKKCLLGLVLGAFLISCSNDGKSPDMDVESTEPASLAISVQSDKSMTRGVITNPGTGETPSKDTENTINNFTVFVYSANSDVLEVKKNFQLNDAVDGKYEISGLMSGPKKVVVLANGPTDLSSIAAGSLYSVLSPIMFNLSTQVTPNNLAMSGEGTIALQPSPSENVLPITLTRVVAKIRLASVTVNPSTGHPAFTPTNVHIMKAKAEASYGVPRNYSTNLDVTTSNSFYGGIAGTVSGSTPQAFLSEPITMNGNVSDNVPYFYVFPNDNTDDNCTLIVIEGYTGVDTDAITYFPIRIRTATTGDNIGYIKRNDHYTINIELNRTGDGVSNPEELVDPATLKVSVTVEDWNDVNPDPIVW